MTTKCPNNCHLIDDPDSDYKGCSCEGGCLICHGVKSNSTMNKEELIEDLVAYFDQNPHSLNSWKYTDQRRHEIVVALKSLLTEREEWVLVPKAVVDELNAIANTVCDLHQNKNRPDEDSVMGWDYSNLTLGTLRQIRKIAAAPKQEEPE